MLIIFASDIQPDIIFNRAFVSFIEDQARNVLEPKEAVDLGLGGRLPLRRYLKSARALLKD